MYSNKPLIQALRLDPVALLLPRRSFLLANAALLSAAPVSEEKLSSSPSLSKEEEKVSRGLKQPTESQPQIMIPDQLELKPVIEGIVQLRDPLKLPNPSDTIYLLITSRGTGDGSDPVKPGTPLGGAAVPLARVRFPFQFVFKADNAFPGQRQALEEALLGRDLMVTARVCGKGAPGADSKAASASPLSCPTKLKAAALAPLLQLKQGTIRVPVTLVLDETSASEG